MERDVSPGQGPGKAMLPLARQSRTDTRPPTLRWSLASQETDD